MRRAVLGLHFGDIVLTAMVVAIVFGWTLVPRLGQWLGGVISGGDRDE